VTDVEKTGKTIDEAVEKALTELRVSRDEVEVEILEQPSKGLFGFLGSKPGKVKVSVIENPSLKANDLLEKVLDVMDLEVEIDVKQDEHGIFISMQGPDLGILIGRRGETLDALQYLVNLSSNKDQEHKQRIILDVEGYRKRREETLRGLAIKLAEKAKQKGRNVVLEPMNSQERRIIHTTLQSRNDIYTFSEGEDPYRKIVISPRK